MAAFKPSGSCHLIWMYCRRVSWNACLPGGFEPRYMVMRGVSEHDYTLTQAAKALMCGGLGLTLKKGKFKFF